MESTDWNMVMGLGGFFVFIGILLLLSGKREEQGYYDALANRNDVHEFVSHDPERAEPGALKIGGWIALAVGIVVLIMGGGFGIWG